MGVAPLPTFAQPIPPSSEKRPGSVTARSPSTPSVRMRFVMSVAVSSNGPPATVTPATTPSATVPDARATYAMAVPCTVAA